MLSSVPIILQAVVWPLLGAAIILAAGRFLPGWLRRLIAAAGAAASLASLRSLAAAGSAAGGMELTWDPLNLLRMGPAFDALGLSLLTGMTLAGLTTAGSLALVPADQNEQRLPWQGLWLMALAGCLVMVMASNLVALSLGSGLLAVAVTALAMADGNSAGKGGWPPLSVAVPGVAATLLIVLAAVQADVKVGHASLLASTLPGSALTLVGTAGLLWVATYIVKAVARPEQAMELLLPCGAGLYLLARTQAVAPVLGAQGWLPIIIVLLMLGGGLLAWLNGVWPGLPVQQLGLAIGFIWLLGDGQPPPVPWPSVTLTLALGVLAVWWNGSAEAAPAGIRLPAPVAERLAPAWASLRAAVEAQVAPLSRWRGTWLGRRQAAVWPAIALGSLAGFPLTAGAIGRWLFYGEVLFRGQALLLVVALIADVLASAAIWTALWAALEAAASRRLRPSSVVSMVGLTVPLVLWGLVPELLGRGLGLAVHQPVQVSPWGLGLLFVLPWLAGGWLAVSSITRRPPEVVEGLRRALHTDWPQRVGSWLSNALVAGLHWLGQVGEGEGWWGWALILLILGALYLVAR